MTKLPPSTSTPTACALNLQNDDDFTSEEDQKVIALVAVYGYKSWAQVASFVPGRNSRECRERWFDHLDPSVSKAPISEEEGRAIKELQSKLGNQWTRIAKSLPGRSAGQVRNYFKSEYKKHLLASAGLAHIDTSEPPAKRRRFSSAAQRSFDSGFGSFSEYMPSDRSLSQDSRCSSDSTQSGILSPQSWVLGQDAISPLKNARRPGAKMNDSNLSSTTLSTPKGTVPTPRSSTLSGGLSFKFDGKSISSLGANGLIKMGSPETAPICRTPTMLRELNDRSLGKVRGASQVTPHASSVATPPLRTGAQSTPRSSYGPSYSTAHVEQSPWFSNLEQAGAGTSTTLLTPERAPEQPSPGKRSQGQTPSKVLPVSPGRMFAADLFGDLASVGAGTPPKVPPCDNFMHIKQEPLPATSTPLVGGAINPRFVPRTPTPLKKALAAIERRRGSIEVSPENPHQLAQDISEIIQREERSRVTTVNANINLNALVAAVNADVPPEPPAHNSADWFKVACGRTTDQLEQTAKARIFLKNRPVSQPQTHRHSPAMNLSRQLSENCPMGAPMGAPQYPYVPQPVTMSQPGQHLPSMLGPAIQDIKQEPSHMVHMPQVHLGSEMTMTMMRTPNVTIPLGGQLPPLL